MLMLHSWERFNIGQDERLWIHELAPNIQHLWANEVYRNYEQGTVIATTILFVLAYTKTQGRNHGWKVEEAKIWAPTPGRLRPALRQRPGWVLGAGGGLPLPLWGSGSITPGKFLKTRMLNPAFWWLLAVKFLAFWKLRPRSWGTNLKVGDQSSRSLRLLRLC